MFKIFNAAEWKISQNQRGFYLRIGSKTYINRGVFMKSKKLMSLTLYAVIVLSSATFASVAQNFEVEITNELVV